MKVTKETKVTIELDEEQANDLSGILVHTVEFERSPFARALYNSLDTDEDRAYVLNDTGDYFIPDDEE